MKHQDLLDKLNACVAACEHCATACLGEDDVKKMSDCIKTDRDCADICALTARLVARDSKHAKHLAKECIEVCKLCADECGKHEHQHCKDCAEACRACEEACKKFAA
ncbi:four-helix bundle copper-binding protein [Roseivirga sp. BDSF3-8]|uniref:four-helix bundle copper-binding protein n=1 Tax=Roseivirga sp. BDSF3-8 TaxID=3241598 RepID=UPI003531E9D3